MKLQSFSSLEIFQVPVKLDFSYLSPHSSKRNESKLPTFIKIYTIRYNFKNNFRKNDMKKFLVLP